MAANKETTGVIYKCPLCFNNFIDVPVDTFEDGKYHCVKCGFVGTKEELLQKYAEIRDRYKLRNTRITLEEQRKF